MMSTHFQITSFANDWTIGSWNFGKQIFDILGQLLHSTEREPIHTTIQEAAQAINDIYLAYQDPKINSGHPSVEGFCWEFWDIVFDLAGQIPHDSSQQDILVTFMASLQDISYAHMTHVPNPWEGLRYMPWTVRDQANCELLLSTIRHAHRLWEQKY